MHVHLFSLTVVSNIFDHYSFRHPGDNPFYSNIDSMPDIRPRRKSVPLVSELVRNQLSINLAEQCPLVYAYMDMYTYKAHGRALALSVPSIFVEVNKRATTVPFSWPTVVLVVVVLFVRCPRRRRRQCRCP